MKDRDPRTVTKEIHGNPFKPNQVTGHIKVAVEDGEFVPETVVDSEGNVVPLVKENPIKKSTGLHKPADIGIPDWLKSDLD